MIEMRTIRISFVRDDNDKKLKCVGFQINTTCEFALSRHKPRVLLVTSWSYQFKRNVNITHRKTI